VRLLLDAMFNPVIAEQLSARYRHDVTALPRQLRHLTGSDRTVGRLIVALDRLLREHKGDLVNQHVWLADVPRRAT
jgi:hypothetical protein